MENEYKIKEGCERLQDYLTRIAKALDKIRTEKLNPNLSDSKRKELNQEESEIRNYITGLMEDDFWGRSRKAKNKYNVVVDVGIIFSYLSMEVLDHLYKYNNPKYMEPNQKYSFDAFVAPYVLSAIDKANGEDIGNKPLRKKISHVKKTIDWVSINIEKNPENVTASEIYKYQHMTGDKMHLSEAVIKDTLLNHMTKEYYYESDSQYEPSAEDDHSIIENEEAINCVKGFLEGLTEVKRYLFLQKMSGIDKADSYKTLSLNKKFMEYAQKDELYKMHLKKEDLSFASSPRTMKTVNNVVCVDPEFLSNQMQRMKKQFARMVNPDKEISKEDLSLALNVVMLDYWTALNK